MPLAKIHVTEGQYDEPRLQKLSASVQDALRGILRVPADDFFQIIHVLPKNGFLRTPSLNERVVAATRISPDDLMIYLYEIPGENVSYGQGLAQRAFISGGT